MEGGRAYVEPIEDEAANGEDAAVRTVGRSARWLVAAMLVFQASAGLGARLNPVETFTAVHRPRASTGR